MLHWHWCDVVAGTKPYKLNGAPIPQDTGTRQTASQPIKMQGWRFSITWCWLYLVRLYVFGTGYFSGFRFPLLSADSIPSW